MFDKMKGSGRSQSGLGKLLTATAAISLMLGSSVWAQDDYPNRPITMIVAYATGGAPDTTARLFSQELGAELGQRIIIENRAGAAGLIGTQVGMAAAPDGYTIMLHPMTPAVLNEILHDDLTFNTRDMVPISLIGTSPQVIAVHGGLPVDNLQEFIEYVRASPGEHAYVSSGPGSIPHLLAHMFTELADLEMVHVSYSSGNVAGTAVASGEAAMRLGTIGGMVPYIEAGNTKALCVLAEERSHLMDEVPTCREEGIDLVSGNWFGLFGPPGMPQEAVDRLVEAIQVVFADEALRERFVPAGIEAIGSTDTEFREFWENEFVFWETVISTIDLDVID